MRRTLTAFLALSAMFVLADCGEAAPHEFPANAAAEFHQSCPATDDVCVCTWDQITRAMPYEEYQTALETFRTRGLMDPRLTRARTHCIERRPAHAS